MGAGLPTRVFMLRLVALLLPLGAAAVIAAPLEEDPAQPVFETKDRRLKEALGQRGGQPVLVNFWAPWCEPCRAEMPSLQRFAERWRARGLTVLTVDVADRKGEGSRFLWDAGVTLPVLYDPDQALTRALGVRALPMTLVLDRQHRVVARAKGAINWDAKALDRQIDSLLR